MDPNRPNSTLPPDLQELVDRTEGLQPWRRLFHASNGTIVVALLASGLVARQTMIWIVGLALVGAVVIDGVRFRVPSVQRLFFRSMARLASPREAGGVASSTWYLAGILVSRAQPTTLRLHTSSTTARYIRPVFVGSSVMSATHR